MFNRIHRLRKPIAFVALLASASGCSHESQPEDEPPSEPSLVFDGEASGFQPVGAAVTFRLDSDHGLPIERAMVFVNGQMLPIADVTVDAGSVSFALPFDGRNDVELLALDGDDGEITGAALLFTGSETLEVRVVDAQGYPVSALVRASLVEETEIFEDASGASGAATFTDVPRRTIVVTARTEDGGVGTAGVVGGGETIIEIRPALPPSPIENNDFSAGLDGWVAHAQNAQLVAHDEDGDGTTPYAADFDLSIPTAGLLGAQTVSRSFEVGEGAREVSVRYRFVTSELPAGYFGSEYNDYFSVNLRAGDRTGSEANSMNGLGLAAFDGAGGTAWREARIAVSPGETVQIDVSVSNVGDNLYDSSVLIDRIEERSLRIEQLALHDIDGAPLTMLSASPHTYFGGHTRLSGTLDIRGDADDAIEEVTLEIEQNGGLVFGQLAESARSAVLGSFGSDERVYVKDSAPLFVIDSVALAALDTSKDGTLETRVRVRTQNGEESVQSTGSVKILKLFEGKDRFTGRDASRGGDDWVLPSVEQVVLASGIQVGDISNMNGGSFAPDHKTHTAGTDVDGWFEGYNDLDAAVADEMIAHLESDYGSRIEFVYVTYTEQPGDSFWEAIKNRTIRGQPAHHIIQRKTGHETHFHWRIRPAP